MKVSLRKANALQNAIQDQIKTIDVKTELSINEFQDATGSLNTARDVLMANDGRRKFLTQALYRVRAQVGRANVESGVADRLTEAAFVDKRLGQLKGLTEAAIAETDAVLAGKLDKIRSRKEPSHSYYDKDSVSTGVLTADQVAVYKAEIAALKKTKQKLNDEVLELNIRTEIELDADTIAMLTSESLV